VNFKTSISAVPENRSGKVVKVDGQIVDLGCPFNDHGARCGARGTISQSTNGLGPWYCRDHAWVILGDERDQRTLPMAEIGQEPITIEAKGDGLDWARRILARLEVGERVGVYADRLAREALAFVVVIRQPGEEG